MTDWTALSDTDLEQDKPLTQSKARALRDNPVAITEAASGAPRILPGALNFPYFMASRTTDQTITANNFNWPAGTKVQCNVENLDPDSLYDNATNYRFTPNRAGLYFVSVSCDITGATERAVLIKKNGSEIAGSISRSASGTTSDRVTASSNAIVSMNGSTDYLEVHADANTFSTITVKSARFFAHALCEA